MEDFTGTISDANRPMPGYVTASDVSLTDEEIEKRE